VEEEYVKRQHYRQIHNQCQWRWWCIQIFRWWQRRWYSRSWSTL